MVLRDYRYRKRLPTDPSGPTRETRRGLLRDGRSALVLLLVSILIIVAVLSHTIVALRAQHSATVAVDVAGRQRMLNKRHLQEVLLTCQGFEADFASTRRIFEDSLDALMGGGGVVINLDTGELGQLPLAANAEIRESLREQGELFQRSTELADELTRLTEEDGKYKAKLDQLLAPNERTHIAANRSVKLITRHSALRSATSVLWELFACVLVGFAGILLGIVLTRVNRGLREEVIRRQQTEQALEKAHDELEDKVSKRTAELERNNQELERFAYVVSHDIQAPLGTITNYIEEIRARESAESEQHLDEFGRFFLENALNSARRMQELVHRVLEYSRVGMGDVAFGPVDLGEVLSEVVMDLDSRITESGAKVEMGPLPTVLGDRVLLGELFSNLVCNAVKFHAARPPLVSIWAERRDGMWRCFVKDNGIGIAEEFRESVFGMFARGESGSEHDGEGIGLAVCKKVVEYHGGEIGVDSEFGKGTTFFFTVPVDKRWDTLGESHRVRRFRPSAGAPAREGASRDFPA